MKKNTKIMLVAGVAIAIALILGVFAEIGIACLFNIQVEGMSYIDYLMNFYSNEWNIVGATLVGIGIMIVGISWILPKESEK